MVGALLSVGLSKINLNDIQYMLEYPKPSSWNTRIFVVPGYALYLSNVTFKPEHLVLTSEELQKKNKLLEPTEVSMNKSNRPFSGLKNFYDKTSI